MSLRDHLRETRHARFVGRVEELALFASAVGAEALPFYILQVYGPGGSGKTALLGEYQRLCEEQGLPVAYLDARDIDPTPDAFERVLSEAMAGLDPGAARGVVLVDTYEAIDTLDDYLRRVWLPALEEHLFVVIAGRNRPAPAWQADPGWREVVRVLPLRNLTPDESTAFLRLRAVPEAQHAAVLGFTHGHPLALALAAERVRQDPVTPFAPGAAPDVVQALLQRFMLEAPSKVHRAALEAAALVRALTEPLLAALLDTDDAYEAFTWLRGLAFMQEGPRGLFPHDLARDVLLADLRWRDPARFGALHKRARQYCMEQLREATTDNERAELIGAYVFLYRTNPIVRPILGTLREAWENTGPRMVGALEAADVPALVAMVAAHEGAAAAEQAAHWLERQPERVQVFRDEQGQPAGFLLPLLLEDMDDRRSSDPATEAAWRYLAEHAPLRTGERALFFRFWMDAEAYQGISAVQGLIFSSMVRMYLTTPRLAFSFLPTAAAEFWSTIFAFARLHRLPEADYTMGERPYAMFGHDWRTEPVELWMERLAEQAPLAGPNQHERIARPRLLVLSEPDFAEAVHEALKQVARPHQLRDSPLLRSRLVMERAGHQADEAERVTV
ncbi:MAG: ATP-binding protein, partial [Rhodothermaceae bacterium]|nr:ATP-binding protein [Rhodothermaceae bacterium]